MVKVPKPNPKSIKKDGPAKTKNIAKKTTKVNSSKEKLKAVVKKVDAKNEVKKNIKSKNGDLIKKPKNVQQNDQKAVQKKKPVKKAESKKHIAESEIKSNQKKLNSGVKEEKSKNTSTIFEQTDFDEEKFKDIVSLENIKKIIKALKSLVEKEVSEKKTSIFSDYRYFLNIASYKIPNCPKRMVKLNVQHSLVDANIDDVVMIVPDLQRGSKVDYEPTVQHYEDLLRGEGIDNIKIVPFNQLRNECTTYEAKRKFANTYDYFLCDGRIVSHVVGFCGKHFQKPRTTIHAVRLDNTKTYKSDIEQALKRTAYRQLHKGDLISIPVGNHRFTINQLAQNIETVISQLKTIFPGGYPNIRNIYTKIDIKGTSSLPLYVNLLSAPQETPNVIGPREQRMLKLKKQANDILSKFSMSKSGEFVKLNKAQVERKQQIRETSSALLSKVEVDSNDSEFKPPLKKVKKDKQVEEDSKSDDENENSEDIQEDSDVSDKQ